MVAFVSIIDGYNAKKTALCKKNAIAFFDS